MINRGLKWQWYRTKLSQYRQIINESFYKNNLIIPLLKPAQRDFNEIKKREEYRDVATYIRAIFYRYLFRTILYAQKGL